MNSVDFCNTDGRILPFKGGQPEMQQRRVVITLDHDEYEALERRALGNDRDGWQEARHIVRQAVRGQQAGILPCEPVAGAQAGEAR